MMVITEKLAEYDADGKPSSSTQRYGALSNFIIALPCSDYLMTGVARVSGR